MCGIFGLMAPNLGVAAAAFAQLGQHNTVRGNLGFGALLRRGPSVTAHRFATPFAPACVPLAGGDGERVTLALGHVRAPTGGQSDSLAELHPFETADLFLAHNGLLLNWQDFPHWQLDPPVRVDSAVILGGIQRHLAGGGDTVAAIRQTVSQLDGQQACWLWHKREQALYLWRVMSPLYWGQSGGQAAFSSLPNDEWAATPLAEGVIYRWHDQTGLEAAATFPFYNPFHFTPR